MGVQRQVNVEQRAEGPRSISTARKPSSWSAIAASRSRRCSTSSTWRSAAGLPDDQRVFVDALDYRKGKDVELRQMAKLLAEKAKQTGVDQQIGPLNPYERRSCTSPSRKSRA